MIQCLNNLIKAEFDSGIDGLDPSSRYLFEDHEPEELISKPLFYKQTWFQAVKAARGRVFMVPEEELEELNLKGSIYHQERKLLRTWLATGRC